MSITLTKMMLAWFSCKSISRSTSRLTQNVYFWLFLANFEVLHFIWEKWLNIWGQLRLTFLYRKNESHMTSRKKFIFHFIIFLLFSENFQIICKWNVILLLIIFLKRSHSLIFINIVSRNLKKFLKCYSFWDSEIP